MSENPAIDRFGGMTVAEVVAIVDRLEGERVVYQVNGGWAVDALVGRQTRRHRDLDVFLDEDALPRTIAWLSERGYSVEVEELPARIQFRCASLRVDLHPLRLDEEGNGTQRGAGGLIYEHRAADRTIGTVGGRAITVGNRDRLIALREGYEHRDIDRRDLELLALVPAEGPGEGSVET